MSQFPKYMSDGKAFFSGLCAKGQEKPPAKPKLTLRQKNAHRRIHGRVKRKQEKVAKAHLYQHIKQFIVPHLSKDQWKYLVKRRKKEDKLIRLVCDPVTDRIQWEASAQATLTAIRQSIITAITSIPKEKEARQERMAFLQEKCGHVRFIVPVQHHDDERVAAAPSQKETPKWTQEELQELHHLQSGPPLHVPSEVRLEELLAEGILSPSGTILPPETPDTIKWRTNWKESITKKKRRSYEVRSHFATLLRDSYITPLVERGPNNTTLPLDDLPVTLNVQQHEQQAVDPLCFVMH